VKPKAPINAGWALNLAVDASITFVLAIYLYQDRRAVTKKYSHVHDTSLAILTFGWSYSSTKTLISKLAYYAISTGLLTLFVSISTLFYARPNHSRLYLGWLRLRSSSRYGASAFRSRHSTNIMFLVQHSQSYIGIWRFARNFDQV
jgi:hypothetical protein